MGGEATELLGGAALAASFAILLGRAGRWVAAAATAQAWMLAAAAACQAWVQLSPGLLLAALIAALGSGLAIPVALRRIAGNDRTTDERAPGPGAALSAIGLVGAAALAVQAAVPAADAAPRAELALALAVLLLGLLTMRLRRDAVGPLRGLLAAGHGVGLAAVAVPGGAGLALIAVIGSGLLAAAAIGLQATRPTSLPP